MRRNIKKYGEGIIKIKLLVIQLSKRNVNIISVNGELMKISNG